MIEEIRARGVSNLHPVGTCRMGRDVDAVSTLGCASMGSNGCALPTPRSCRKFRAAIPTRLRS